MSYICCAGILLLFVCSALSNRRIGNCECGVHNNAQYRIANGQRASPNEFPWLVTIKTMGDLFCGGAIINDRYVLTAGHCVQWNDKKQLSVVVGQHSRHNRDGQHIPVAKKIVHEEFHSHQSHDDMDIALVKLIRPIRFSSKVSPICLPYPGTAHVHLQVTVAGWGAKGPRNKDTNILRKAELRVLSNTECKQTLMQQYVHDLVLCAYGHNTDVCRGDSGGPLTYEKELGKSEIVGVVSFGRDCGNLGTPGIYTKVSEFVDWIERNAWDGIWCRD